MANGIPDKVIFYCQKCGNKISKEDTRELRVEAGQQKGLVLQVCISCWNPGFRNRAIYK